MQKLTRRFLYSLLLILAAIPSLPAQTLVNLDFETSGDVVNNFRTTYNSSSSLGQTSNGGANDYMTVSATTAGGLRSMVYDATPANNTVQNIFSGSVQISGDISSDQTNTSFGIFIVNPSAESSSVHQLALFNWDSSGSNDLFRIFTGSQISGGQAVGSSQYSSGSVISGANADGAFSHFTLTYRPDTIDSTRAVLNLTVGAFSTGDVVLGAGTYLSNFEIGLRFSPSVSGKTISLDNFQIAQVPEPSVSVLLVMSAFVFGLLQRTHGRKKRRLDVQRV